MQTLPGTEERKQLQLYICRALDRDISIFNPDNLRNREAVLARNLYSYYCTLLRLSPESAAVELKMTYVQFRIFNYNTVRILEYGKRGSEIYAEACNRIQLQLLDPEQHYTFGPLRSAEVFSKTSSARRARDKHENTGFPVSVRYKSSDGYINHSGEIILRP